MNNDIANIRKLISEMIEQDQRIIRCGNSYDSIHRGNINILRIQGDRLTTLSKIIDLRNSR